VGRFPMLQVVPSGRASQLDSGTPSRALEHATACRDQLRKQPSRSSRGNAARGRLHSLRVLSSEAVPNPFPTGTELLPTSTVLDEFGILRGRSFETIAVRTWLEAKVAHFIDRSSSPSPRGRRRFVL
jgi:hypothetical protein